MFKLTIKMSLCAAFSLSVFAVFAHNSEMPSKKFEQPVNRLVMLAQCENLLEACLESIAYNELVVASYDRHLFHMLRSSMYAAVLSYNEIVEMVKNASKKDDFDLNNAKKIASIVCEHARPGSHGFIRTLLDNKKSEMVSNMSAEGANHVPVPVTPHFSGDLSTTFFRKYLDARSNGVKQSSIVH